jgi:predicted O-methyltransferase YrrM
MIRLLKLIFRPLVTTYWGPVVRRVHNLETAFETLLERPKYLTSEEAGFNGQRLRKQIFRDLVTSIRFNAIIETGTWIGDTTGYMAEQSGLPVYTVEIDRRFFALAKHRLQHLAGITFRHGDSRTFLSELVNSEFVHDTLFVYLDAHWYDDLPLVEELRLVYSHWPNAVTMIDDFQVPGDGGYGYDDYGPKKCLAMRLIKNVVIQYNLVPFFPASPSSQETGHRRGCVVLAKKGEMSNAISAVESLTACNMTKADALDQPHTRLQWGSR